MSDTEQYWPVSPAGLDTKCPEYDLSLISGEIETVLCHPASPAEVCAEYDKGVLWTETDAKHEWPMKALSTQVARYAWSDGAGELIRERERVAKIESLRFIFGYGYKANHYVSMDGIFTVPLSFHDAFVGSHAERITLMDRVRTYYNFNWKRDAKAEVQKGRDATARGQGRTTMSTNQEQVFDSRLQELKREADGLFQKRIDDVLVLQALTEELKPETRELVKRCKSHEQLVRCMLDANANLVRM
jgi:hypothetical protein